MNCVKCGHALVEGAAFCPYCGEKVSGGTPGENLPIYQADVKGKLKSGKLVVYRDRTEFVTSSVQKTIFNYSALAAVRKKLGVGTVLGLGLDHIDFITEDGSIESCPISRKDVHEAFLRIQEAIAPYLAQRKERLLAQGIRYSLISGTGLASSGILNISGDSVEFKPKTGQSRLISFRDVKAAGITSGSLEFSLTDGTSKAFAIDRELQDEVLAFVQAAIEPYIAERKASLLAQGIYFSSLSSHGPDSGTLNILEDRAEFTSKAGQTTAVSFQDVRAVRLFSDILELSLTDGTSKSFTVEKDMQDGVLSFVQTAIQPYVLKRTVGFDAPFGIDERIELNEARGVFHILRQGGNEISKEYPLSALSKCEQTECGAPKSALGLLAGAAKAVGVRDKLGAPDADDIISYAGVELTLLTDQGQETELVRFGDFSLGMSRTNKKYGQYLAEISKFMEYLSNNCPECALIVPAPPEPEEQPEALPADTAGGEAEIAADSGPAPETPAAVSTASEMEQLGITKYIEGISNFINSCSTPMTIAVQGSWGSGKSSILKMLSDSLSGRCAGRQIWFTPRRLLQANSEDPLPIHAGKALIRQLSGSEDGASKDSAVKIAKGVIELVAGMIAPDSSAGQNLVEGLFKDGSAIPPEKLVDVFSRLVEEQAGGPEGKVIIFINELDKLAPAKVVELLEALRSFLDCEGCVFVAAIDYSFFQRGVRENPDMDLDAGQEKALFDEIFQMSFRIPVSGQQIKSYVNDKLEHMGIHTDNGTELEFYTALIHRSVGSEPKNIDRLFNSFLLLKNMADTQLYENRVQRLMLFALLCMQTRFHAVYDQLKQMRNQITPQLLSGLGGETSEVTARSELTGEEASAFRSFAQVFCDIINTDRSAGISRSECDVFVQVLEFSSITSK